MLDQPSLNLSDLISTHAKFRKARTAFVCAERRVTWETFDKRVSKVANALLDGGLKKGDKVALLTLSNIEAGTGNPTVETLRRVLDALGMEMRVDIKQ